jgi:hypothetical protein
VLPSRGIFVMAELKKQLSPERTDSNSPKETSDESPWATELHNIFKPGWYDSPLLTPLKNCYDKSMTVAQLVRGATQDSDQFLPSIGIDRGNGQSQLQLGGKKVDRDFVEQAIKQWDTNKNGKLGLGELDKVIVDPAASGDEAALAYALKSNWKGLNKAFGHSISESIAEQNQMDNLQNALPNIEILGIGGIGHHLDENKEYSNQFGGSEGLRSFLRQNPDTKGMAFHAGDLADLIRNTKIEKMDESEPDKPHSASVSKADLDQLIAGKSPDIAEKFKKSYGGDAVESGKYLKEHFEQFLNESNHSDKIDQYGPSSWRDRNNSIVAMWDQIQESFLEGKKRLDAIKNASSELYANNDHRNIVPEAIQQGNIGDCYFLGSLAALASANPDAVNKLVSFDKKSGNYTVTFPGLEPEIVKAPTALEMSMYAQASKHGIWGPVIEKAFGQYCNRAASHRALAYPWSHNLPQDAAEGGSWQSSLAVLTGKKTEEVDLSKRPYAQALENAFANPDAKRPVVAQIPGHMFAVTGYDAKTGSITVYDQQQPEKGRFQMSAAEIKMKIQKFHIGER